MIKSKVREQINQDVQVFLAKGGKISKCPTRAAVKKYPRSFYGEPEVTVKTEPVINYDALPAALRAKMK